MSRVDTGEASGAGVRTELSAWIRASAPFSEEVYMPVETEKTRDEGMSEESTSLADCAPEGKMKSMAALEVPCPS